VTAPSDADRETLAALEHHWAACDAGELWVTEYLITYTGEPVHTVSIMELRDGKVARETHYFAEPFDTPGWRAQWIERMPGGT
jgi:hypothetical protein